jgi:parvulin-like peptidyl-prolyl isomerase
MAKNPQKNIVTKKHLARLERERLQNRYILIVSAIILLIVVGMVGYGILDQYVLRPGQPVAIVNGDEISTREFQVNVRFSRQQYINQYIQTQQYMQLLGGDESTQSYFEQSLQQIQLQLDSPTLGQNVLDYLVEDRLIRQEAENRGITVSSEEVDKAFQADFNYFPNGTPTPTATQEQIPTSTLNATQLALVPLTATITSQPTPTGQFTPSPLPESTITPTLDITPTSTIAPTVAPTPYTEVAFQENYQSYIDYLQSELDITEADIRYIYESQLYRDKVFDIITKDIPRDQEQVWARHILVEDEATAQGLYERLINGEDFSALAAEASTDSSNAQNGGDLGWFGVGVMDPDFEKIAFNLNIGEISEPFQTSFGWHIVQVLGKETRPLSTTDYQQLQQTKFSDWVETQRSDTDVKIFDYWSDRVPVIPTLPSTSG